MTETFEFAFNYLIKNEGTQFVNDPADSGGATKFGITQAHYAVFSGLGVSTHDMEALTIEDAKKFYFAEYWQFLKLDKLVSPVVATCIFDSSVLYGVIPAGMMAQRAANFCGADLKADGILGSKSIAALNLCDEKKFLEAFHSHLIERIDQLVVISPKNIKFFKGWVARADRLLSLDGLTPTKGNV